MDMTEQVQELVATLKGVSDTSGGTDASGVNPNSGAGQLLAKLEALIAQLQQEMAAFAAKYAKDNEVEKAAIAKAFDRLEALERGATMRKSIDGQETPEQPSTPSLGDAFAWMVANPGKKVRLG